MNTRAKTWGLGLAAALFAAAAGSPETASQTLAGGDLAAVAGPTADASQSAFPSDEEIQQTYDLIADYHGKYLGELGVKLPQLRKSNGDYVLSALTLVYLARGYPDVKTVSKSELTQFMRQYVPEINDVQQARHLAAQGGWYILSGTRKDGQDMNVLPGEYRLISLERPIRASTTSAAWISRRRTTGNSSRPPTAIAAPVAAPRKASPTSTGPTRSPCSRRATWIRPRLSARATSSRSASNATSPRAISGSSTTRAASWPSPIRRSSTAAPKTSNSGSTRSSTASTAGAIRRT